MMEFIIVHTQYGYLMNESPTFTHDIAEAMITTNYQAAEDLCDRYMACMWKRENGGKWEPYYQPNNTFKPKSAKEILGGIFK